jgi:N-acetylglucosaminyldiphosphoundecaprenol N-acetyl-beta-D-mannosaminyltransferase
MFEEYKSITLLGTRIDNIPKEDVLEYIKNSISSNNSAIISYVNLHAINLSDSIPWFRDFLNESQIVFCDGVGVQLAARLTGQKLDYRLTPPDWIDDLCDLLKKNNCGAFLLGAKPGVTESAANMIRNKHAGIKIESHYGYFDLVGRENDDVVEMINQSKAEILLVGMGMPLQEQWIVNNKNRLSHVKVIMPVGALFDYIAKSIPRGPKFMTNHGLEWLARLFIEPKRLWRRYIIGIPLVFFRIIQHHLLQK